MSSYYNGYDLASDIKEHIREFVQDTGDVDRLIESIEKDLNYFYMWN